jgi:hypothetical protein
MNNHDEINEPGSESLPDHHRCIYIAKLMMFVFSHHKKLDIFTCNGSRVTIKNWKGSYFACSLCFHLKSLPIHHFLNSKGIFNKYTWIFLMAHIMKIAVLSKDTNRVQVNINDHNTGKKG